jgi:hypothetical protein
MFNNLYIRGVGKDDFDDMLTTDAQVKARLKEIGVSGYSTKSGNALYEMLLKAEPNAKIYKYLNEKLIAENPDKIIIDADKYDLLADMRKVIKAHEEFNPIFNTMYYDTSITCEIMVEGLDEWVKVKIRPSMITKDFTLPYYVVTDGSSSINNFQHHCRRAMLPLKQIFMADLLSVIYKKEFKPTILVQSLKKPYIPAQYLLDNPAEIWKARRDYTKALIDYATALETGIWGADYSTTQSFPVDYKTLNEYNEFLQTLDNN